MLHDEVTDSLSKVILVSPKFLIQVREQSFNFTIIQSVELFESFFAIC